MKNDEIQTELGPTLVAKDVAAIDVARQIGKALTPELLAD